MTVAFPSTRDAALALLTKNDPPLSRKAGSFTGQLAVDDTPLSPAQRSWLDQLLQRAGLPPLSE